jgi:hypothetical protein
MIDLVYSEMGQGLVRSHEYRFWLDDNHITVAFPEGVTLSEKCAAIYDKWGQDSVRAFADRCYRDVIEWGFCVPCDAEAPFDKSDPTDCLVCGSRQRDDNYKLED